MYCSLLKKRCMSKSEYTLNQTDISGCEHFDSAWAAEKADEESRTLPIIMPSLHRLVFSCNRKALIHLQWQSDCVSHVRLHLLSCNIVHLIVHAWKHDALHRMQTESHTSGPWFYLHALSGGLHFLPVLFSLDNSGSEWPEMFNVVSSQHYIYIDKQESKLSAL